MTTPFDPLNPNTKEFEKDADGLETIDAPLGKIVFGDDYDPNESVFMSEIKPFGLGVYKQFPDVPDIEYGTHQAACFDLRAYFHQKAIKIFETDNEVNTIEGYERIGVMPGQRILVPTGIILDIPEGYSVRVHPRSGLAIKQGINLVNCEGVIDSDYTHELMVPLMNNSSRTWEIRHGDRIAQAEVVQVLHMDIRYIGNAPGQKGNREGGFGSTGHK